MNQFTHVQMSKPDSSRFDLSHDLKFSFDMGRLVPTLVMDCLPGDRVSLSTTNMLRFAPLLSPVMHRVRVVTRYFFVPNRLLWSGWEDFITGNSDAAHPFVTLGLDDGPFNVPGGLADYLGYPFAGDAVLGENILVNPFPVGAYLKVYDDYYRDQNLEPDDFFLPFTSGDNSTNYLSFFDGSVANYLPLRTNWRHDYFTSCLPFAQKGDAVQVPLTAEANIPVVMSPNTPYPGAFIRDSAGDTIPFGDEDNLYAQAASPFSTLLFTLEAGGDKVFYDPNGSLVVDIQQDAVDINTLRRAIKLQEWLERNARGGTRYVEHLMAHFGVRSSDARLQRSEYLGGLTQNMTISEVLSTANDATDGIPVGYLGGHGISVGSDNAFSYYCEEHGWIIGLTAVVPDTAYMQGLPRSHSRLDRLDYAFPTFANIGEQEVLNKEIYVEHSEPDLVFGYIPRYSEYRFVNSRVAGEMKTNLSFWHLGRIFENDPQLNSTFVKCDPSTRIFAVEDGAHHIYAHVFHKLSAIRKLPKFGVPSI